MNDRELLELAAKAYWAGEIDDVVSIEWSDSDNAVLYTHADNQDHNGRDCTYAWNPLTDDADALRLAVKLGIQINPDASRTEQATAYRHDIGWIAEKHEDHTHPCGAVRKAIVRAAAAMANIAVTRKD